MSEVVSGGPKDAYVEIKSITANDSGSVYGLGDDQNVYIWNPTNHVWNMYNTSVQG